MLRKTKKSKKKKRKNLGVTLQSCATEFSPNLKDYQESPILENSERNFLPNHAKTYPSPSKQQQQHQKTNNNNNYLILTRTDLTEPSAKSSNLNLN